MKKIVKKTEAGQQYTAAHEAHYKAKDLGEALKLYQDVMNAHPEAQEAEYSRSQIQNIVSSVVPKQELFDAQVGLALVHVAHGTASSSVPNPNTQSVVDSLGESTI